MSESMREEFEAWVKNHNASLCEDRFDQPEEIRLDRQGGVYIWANAESAWLAWQASRASLCVEFPLPVKRAHHEYDLGYNEALDHCEEAIHAAGVKTN